MVSSKAVIRKKSIGKLGVYDFNNEEEFGNISRHNNNQTSQNSCHQIKDCSPVNERKTGKKQC